MFALFFPLPLAITATAVVHFANNNFKFGLMAKQADWRVVARFSVTAAVAATAGANLLDLFDKMPVVASYTLGGSTFGITVINAVIGTLIVVFALGDITRLSSAGVLAKSHKMLTPVAVGTICAFIRSFAGKRMLQKVTLYTVQIVVVVAMLLIGVELAVGLVWHTQLRCTLRLSVGELSPFGDDHATSNNRQFEIGDEPLDNFFTDELGACRECTGGKC